MKSKKTLHLFTMFTAFMLFLALHACDPNQMLTPDKNSDANYDSAQYAIYESADETAGISDATLDSDMSLAKDSPTDYNALGENRGRQDFMNRRHEQGMHLKMVLSGLQLTDAQRTQLLDQLKQYRECIAVPIQEFRDEAGAILADAHAQRQAIVDSVNASVLTRDDAQVQLQALNQEKRAELYALQTELGLHAAICECKVNLLTQISTLLDSDQKALYDQWYTRLNGACFAPTDSTGSNQITLPSQPKLQKARQHECRAFCF